MDFDLDVFVSYAHLDNAAPGEQSKGWVARLHETLEWRLAQLLGKPPRIWRDPKLHGDDVFEAAIVDRVHSTAVLVSVVSPRYVHSEWTTRELQEFCRAAEQQRGVLLHDKSRVFKVLKTPVPLDQQIPPLCSVLGYEFFRLDPETGNFREFDEQFGSEYRQKFLMKLDDLAQDLSQTLTRMLDTSGAIQPPLGVGAESTVYLAISTLDLHDQCEAIRRELQQHGYAVLPVRPLPLTSAELEAAVREDLARCSMSIHLVGKRFSLTPEGGVASLAEIQNELAVERAEQGGFTRLVWIPPDLQVDDPRQQQVIDGLRADSRAANASDLLETPLEQLRAVIHAALERGRAAKAPASVPHQDSATATTDVPNVYLLYDQRDSDAVVPCANFLFDQNLEVIQPVFTGDETEVREYHEENLRNADCVVIVFGAASELWVRRKLTELHKIAGYGRTKPAPSVVVCVLAPTSQEKERFRSHEAIVLRQYDGFSPDTWLPIVARLKE